MIGKKWHDMRNEVTEIIFVSLFFDGQLELPYRGLAEAKRS